MHCAGFDRTTALTGTHLTVHGTAGRADLCLRSLGGSGCGTGPAYASLQPPRWPSGKASASRAEGPGFESRLLRDFFGVESYQ